MIERYVINEQNLVYLIQEWPDESTIKTLVGPIVNVKYGEDDIVLLRFDADTKQYAEKERIPLDSDAETVEGRFNYWTENEIG